MSNEELVALIQAGDRERLPELWEGVRRFVWKQANRRYLLTDGLGGVEVDDLRQSGFLALAAAVDTFDPAAGRSFVSWLADYVKTEFAVAGGYRSRKQSFDPLHRAGSLDVPVSEDIDTFIVDLIEDPDAAQAFRNAERRLYVGQLQNTIESALAQLPPDQRAAVIGRYWRDEAVDDRALRSALRTLRHPRISRALQAAL